MNMTDKKTELMSPNDTPAATPDAGLSRRRLVRAGLSAAPVMAALQSNSVLAGGGSGGNCLRPSTFSSLYIGGPKALMSRDPRTGITGVCKSPNHWANGIPHRYRNVMFLASGSPPHNDKGGGGKGKDDKDDKKDDNKDRGNNGQGGGQGNWNTGASSIKTPFTEDPGLLGRMPYKHATLVDVLASDAGDDIAKLARYVTAAYLSNLNHEDWLQMREISAIWNGRGNWVTINGETWTLSKTLAFFEMVYFNKVPPGQQAA
jgi:hypothetical protein